MALIEVLLPGESVDTFQRLVWDLGLEPIKDEPSRVSSAPMPQYHLDKKNQQVLTSELAELGWTEDSGSLIPPPDKRLQYPE